MNRSILLLVYFVMVEAVGIAIGLLIFSTDYIRATMPDLPPWILPIALSVVIVSIGFALWHRMSQAHTLKYDFITVATHKFRTPLTRIKWAAEDALPFIPAEKKEDLTAILESERQLLELTDVIVRMSLTDASRFDYVRRPVPAEDFFKDFREEYLLRGSKKGIAVSFDVPSGLMLKIDPDKSRFIFQILLDNALSYTPWGGNVSLRASVDDDRNYCRIEVSDSGIGMSPETMSRVFRRFYRGENARFADTEGMGIGLYMAKDIVEKQRGKITVRSDGEGKGSTFVVRLPFA